MSKQEAAFCGMFQQGVGATTKPAPVFLFGEIIHQVDCCNPVRPLPQAWHPMMSLSVSLRVSGRVKFGTVGLAGGS